MEEEWKVIEEYEKRYGVSNLGRVRNNKTGKILSPYLQKRSNTIYISTRYKNKTIMIYVKLEVYKNFVDKKHNANLNTIINIDGDFYNNNINNLKVVRKNPLNKYKILDNFVIGYIGNIEFYIDKLDYEKIKNICWHMNNNGYVVTTNGSKKENCYLHRFVAETTKNEVIDHINRNKLDNRKLNLRRVTTQQNNFNKSLMKRNKTGIIGVNYFINNTKNHGESIYWRYQIKYSGKTESKQFKTKEEAITARLKAEKLYFGEFAPQKHLFEKYGIK